MKFLVQCNFSERGFPFGLIVSLALWINITPGSAQTLAEGLDTTNLVWTTGGNTFWFGQTTNTHDGVDAVRSGNISSNQTSWIETEIIGPATLNYWLKTVPDNGSLGAWMTINDEPEFRVLLRYYPPQWAQGILDLGIGTNRIRWNVSSYYNSTDAGFVGLDQVEVLPPRPLSFTYESGDQTVYSGEYASFSASVIGTPPFGYQWRKDGTNIPGATNAWVGFEVTTMTNSGNYSVVVSNSQGFIVSSNATLSVLPPSSPFFTYEPESQSVYTWQNIYLSGSVDGSPPFTFQWRKDGTNLPGMISTSSWNSAWLEFTNVTTTDAGNYTLFVTNDYGSVESASAVITVIPSVAPIITRHPRSLEVVQGVNTWMSVAASGDPAPTYSWTKLGDIPPPPTDPPWPPFPQPGQPVKPKRSFTNVISADAGIYFATATNLGGETRSREALLTVLPPITVLGSWWQGAEDIYVTNGLAFLAQGASGFAILSVSNPVTPVLLGGYNTPGFASAVQVVGNRAYVADGSAGLQIFSITNPYSPALLGNYNTPYSAVDVSVRSNLAYVADGKSGLLIINVSNPAFPFLAGSFKTNFNAGHVRVAGDYAFVSSLYSEVLPGTNVAGFFVVNVADPSHPAETGRLPFGIGNFDVRGQTVFGVDGNSLSVITVTNPAQPTILSLLNSYGYPVASWPPFPFPSAISALDVRVVNDIAYVGGYSGDEARLYAVDVRAPTEPIPVGYYTNTGQRYTLWAESNLVYFAGSESSLEIIQTPFVTTSGSRPHLTLAPQPAMQLGIHGRRGFHYDLEQSISPVGPSWQAIQTILLTNDTAAFPLTPTSSNAFFRLKQLD